MPSSSDAATDLTTRLRKAVRGQVTVPGDTDYDDARAVFAANFDHRPAAIVRTADDADVAHVVNVAAETGVELTVRSGGHSPAGHSTSDGGIVLDLRDLDQIDIDPDSRTAWAGAGATTGAYVTAAAEHGLTTGVGDTGSVGLGGLTLAGGVGFLSRKYGLTIDEVQAADIVTADGQRVRTDPDNHPDLFWAIRGGGGNVGVVTRFKYRLRDVSEFVGGALVLPATPDVVERFVAEADAAPDELTSIVAVMPAPPVPFIPSEAHGTLVVLAQLAYAGGIDAAERAIAPFRTIAPPLADTVGPKPYSAMFAPPPPMRPVVAGRAFYLDEIDGEAAGTAIEQVRASTAMLPVLQLRVLGGAVGRVPDDATAYAHRGRRVLANVNAIFQHVEDIPEHDAWASKLHQSLHPVPGVYAGFLGPDAAGRIQEAYPGATWDRLVEVKRRYDPTNLFRNNHPGRGH